MTKNEILDYIMETPGNTNRQILFYLLDEISGGSSEINEFTFIEGSNNSIVLYTEELKNSEFATIKAGNDCIACIYDGENLFIFGDSIVVYELSETSSGFYTFEFVEELSPEGESDIDIIILTQDLNDSTKWTYEGYFDSDNISFCYLKYWSARDGGYLENRAAYQIKNSIYCSGKRYKIESESNNVLTLAEVNFNSYVTVKLEDNHAPGPEIKLQHTYYGNGSYEGNYSVIHESNADMGGSGPPKQVSVLSDTPHLLGIATENGDITIISASEGIYYYKVTNYRGFNGYIFEINSLTNTAEIIISVQYI